MPQLIKKLGVEDYGRRGTGSPRMDLALYQEMIADLGLGEGAEIALEDGETQRVVKRRFSMAAGQRGQAMKWRTSTKEGQLRFQLITREQGKSKQDKTAAGG